jgi:hypothetical protein
MGSNSADRAAESAASGLRVGVGVTVINPFLDVPLAGYFYDRSPQGIHDDLHAKALLFDNETDQIVLVACDLVHLPREAVEDARLRVQKTLGIPPERVLISATHSHTGPQMVPQYVEHLGHWIADSVETAHHNKQSVKLLRADEREASLPFNRRYVMRDGKVVTNPGFLNSDIVNAVGPINPRLSVLTAETENGERIMTWVNYGLHQDTVGGDWISADYSYYLGRMLSTFEGSDMTTVFTIGAAADVNHWDVCRPGPQRGVATARRIGEVLGAGVLKAYAHLEPAGSSRICAMSSTLALRLQSITPEDIEKATKILSVPAATDVDFTLDRVWAFKVMKIHDGNSPNLDAEVQVLTMGDQAFVGIPGELFSELGMEVIEKSPFPSTYIVQLANQNIGYIPTKKAFEEGGYEPTCATIAPGGGELIVQKALNLLNQCHE